MAVTLRRGTLATSVCCSVAFPRTDPIPYQLTGDIYQTNNGAGETKPVQCQVHVMSNIYDHMTRESLGSRDFIVVCREAGVLA